MRIKDNPNAPAIPKIGIVGKVKIGEKVVGQNGKERPASLDYFRVDTDAEYQQMFLKAYGEKPKKITIVFLTNDPNEAAKHFYEMRDSAGKRIAYGDGETFYIAAKGDDNVVRYVVHTPPNAMQFKQQMEIKYNCVWRERLTMSFAVVGIPVIASWEFSTNAAASTIGNIIGAIDSLFAISGRIAGIPFDLSVKMCKSDKAGSASRYPVVTLAANISAESAEKVRALPQSVVAILTEERINQLCLPQAAVPDASTLPNKYEYAPHIEIESTPTAQQQTADSFFDGMTLITVDDFNAARNKVIELSTTNKPLAADCAQLLGDKAQERGIELGADRIYRQLGQ